MFNSSNRPSFITRVEEVIRIGQVINQELVSPEHLFKTLQTEASNILDTTYFFMLSVYQPQTNTMDLYMADRGEYKTEESGQVEGACKYVLDKKRHLLIEHYTEEAASFSEVTFVQIPGTEDEMPESLIFVPLLIRDVPLGVLSAQSLHPHTYDNEDLLIVKLLGNQIASALSGLRLFDYLHAVNQTAQKLTRQLNATALLQDLVNEIREITKADLVLFYPYLQGDETFKFPIAASGVWLAPEYPKSPKVTSDDVAWLSLRHRKPEFARASLNLYKKVGGDPKLRSGNFEVREQVASSAAIPLRIGETDAESESVGVLFLNFRQRQLFDAPQRNLIESLANYAAIAIKNSRRLADLTSQQLKLLEVLRKVDQEISKTLDLAKVMQTILEEANDIIRTDDAGILLYNPRTRKLEMKANIGRGHDSRRNASVPVDRDLGMTLWAYKKKKPARCNNVRTDPQWRDIYFPTSDDILSEIDVPLLSRDQVIGVINFESTKEGAFDQEKEDFLTLLAEKAVLAIQNATAYDNAASGKQRLVALHEVDKQIIEQYGDPGRVIQAILHNARGLTGAEYGDLHLYKNGDLHKSYFLPAESQDKIRVDFFRTHVNSNLGIVAYVAQEKRPYFTVGDAQADPHYQGLPNIHSEVAVPLLGRDGTLVGVLNLESPRLHAFDEDDQWVLELFANQAVISLVSAYSYSNERKQARRFEILWEVGREMGKIADVSQIEEAYKIVGGSLSKSHDCIVIIRRYVEPDEEFELVLEEGERPTSLPERIPMNQKGVNTYLYEQRQTIIVDNVDARPQGAPKPIADHSIKSFVGTPIQFGSNYYGNLILSHETAGHFEEADIKLIEGLAQHLAITIHRLAVVQAQLEAEQNAKDLEIFSELGQTTYELTHRLGNELGLVQLYVNRIRRQLARNNIQSTVIEQELNKVVRDVSAVLNISKGLTDNIASIGNARQAASVVALADWLQASVAIIPIPDNIRLTLLLASDLRDVQMVPSQIDNILRNLVMNAVEAINGDPGKIIIRANSIRDFVEVEIEDDGPGIDTKLRPKIFNLYVSSKSSSGFGLWAARRYARANGGDLLIKSSPLPAKGATFVLRLPIPK